MAPSTPPREPASDRSLRPPSARTYSTPLDDIFWRAAHARSAGAHQASRARATTLNVRASSDVHASEVASSPLPDAAGARKRHNSTAGLLGSSPDGCSVDEWQRYRHEAAQRQARHRRRVRSFVENGARGQWGHRHEGVDDEGEEEEDPEDAASDSEEEGDEQHKGVVGEDRDEVKRQQQDDTSPKPQVGSTVPADPEREAAADAMSEEKRLLAIQEEFGPVEERWGVNGGAEQLLGHAPCVLHRRAVLVKGISLLTTHRLCFLAKLPPPDPSATLKSGACSFKRQGRFHSKRRIWLELKHDTLTAYPSSEERYNPLGCALLSEARRVLPQRWEKGSVLKLRIDGHGVLSFDFGTTDAAQLWRKELEAALFAIHVRSDRIRIAVPLARVLGVSNVGSMRYTRAVHVDVEHGKHLTLGFADVYKEYTELMARVVERKPGAWREVMREAPDVVFEVEGGPSRAAHEGDTHSPSTSDDDEEAKTSGEALAVKLIHRFALQCAPEELRIVSADIAYRRPGALALSPSHLVFYRRGWTHETHLRLPLSDVEGVEKGRSHFRLRHYGLRIRVRGHADLVFEVARREMQDAMCRAIEEAIARVKGADSSAAVTETASKGEDGASVPGAAPSTAATAPSTHPVPPKPLNPSAALLAEAAAQRVVVMENSTFDLLPKVVNEATTPYRLAPMRICCLTIGSRGDVQPYIALAMGLKRHGHHVTIASHPEYRTWVESHGISFRGLGGDPATLMKVAEEHRLFSPQFFMDSVDRLRNWLDELLREAREATWDAELIIESPSTFAGIHCAEANGCFYMRAFSLLWTKTSAYPHAFAPQPSDVVPDAIHNLSSYALFDSLFWRSSASQINRWRKHMLGLAPTSLASLHQDKVPFLYCFSPHVIPPPLDWPTNCYASGYWVLEGEAEAQPPEEGLVRFLDEAKRDGVPVAYVGFGSIVFEKSLAEIVYQGVTEAGVRAVFAKGWSDRLRKDKGEKEPEPPKDVYVLDAVPHDWLFPRIDLAAVHHGGAGTTAATLRHGLPTLIHPSFGDQHLWARRVEALGVGVRLASLTAKSLALALKEARNNRIMKEKCEDLSTKLKEEKGVENAISFIYSHLSASKRIPRPLAVEQERSASDPHPVGGPSDEDPKPPTPHKSKTWSLGTSSLRRVASPLGIFARSSSEGHGHGHGHEHGHSEGEGEGEDENRTSTDSAVMGNEMTSSASEGEARGEEDLENPRRGSQALSTPRTSHDEGEVTSSTQKRKAVTLPAPRTTTRHGEGEEHDEVRGPSRSSSDAGAAVASAGTAQAVGGAGTSNAGGKLTHGMALLHHIALPSLMRAKAQEDDVHLSDSDSKRRPGTKIGPKAQGEGQGEGEGEGEKGEEEKTHQERVMEEKRSHRKAKEEDVRRRKALEEVMRRERERRQEQERGGGGVEGEM